MNLAEIAAGQDINEQMAGNLQTPLMASVLGGHVFIVRALLELGADHTIPEKDGYTPMHGAGFQGRAEIAAILMEHGVPRDAPHPDGFLPFHRACWGTELRHADALRAFIKAGNDPNAPAQNGLTCGQMTKNPHIKIILRDLANKQKEEL